MNTPSKLPEIKKEAFKKARESLGLSAKDLSGMACLSVRQIEQIENGETSSFYGAQIKITAAKKVAGLLKLKEEDAFDLGEALPNKSEDAKNSEKALKETAKKLSSTAERTSQKVQEHKLSEANASQKTDDAKKRVSPSNEVGRGGSSKNPKKSLYIFVGVAAILVFSIVNLRPLFFPEAVKEEAIVVEPTQAASSAVAPVDPEAAPAVNTPEPVAVAAAPIPAAARSTECPPTDAAPVAYKPDAPKKAGDMVYLQSKTAQTVCVIDANGKIQNKTLEPDVGVSVYGKPPLKVLTSGTAQVDFYYQGVKVRLSNITAKSILLEPAEFIQPLAPTDSQFR